MKVFYVIYFALLFIVLVIADQEEPDTNGTEYVNKGLFMVLSDSNLLPKMVDS
jgi:hypothetical protein